MNSQHNDEADAQSPVAQQAPSGDSGEPGKGRAAGVWRPAALLAAVVTIIVVARLVSVGERLLELRDWIESLGPWGPVAFIAIYVAATVAALPGSVLTVVAGGIFGPVRGVVIVSIASTIGASLSFLVGRYFARDAVARWLSTKEKFRKLEEMTRQHGAAMVAITRLVPLFPFNLLNYGFGLTAVPFRTYVFWSWLCMLPGTVLYVVGAAAVVEAVTEGKVPWLLAAVVLGAAAALALVVRRAKRKLQTKGGGENAGRNSNEGPQEHD